MQAVDTNVLIRALTRDDPEQGPAAEAFIRDHAPVWVSHVVLVETVWVLESVYDCGKPQLVEALTRIIDNRELFLEEPAVVRAALEMYQAKGKVQFEDCMILEIARKAGHVPLATFDRALGKVEGVIIVS
jgi:predicted nucleic-acid-binding protein